MSEVIGIITKVDIWTAVCSSSVFAATISTTASYFVSRHAARIEIRKSKMAIILPTLQSAVAELNKVQSIDGEEISEALSGSDYGAMERLTHDGHIVVNNVNKQWFLIESYIDDDLSATINRSLNSYESFQEELSHNYDPEIELYDDRSSLMFCNYKQIVRDAIVRQIKRISCF
jgi:hypothetical protein